MPNLGKWPQGCLALLDNAVNAVHCFVLTDKQRISFALAALKMRQAKLLRLSSNLRRLHRSKNNHRKFIVIGQIIGSGKIDSFMCIKSVFGSISIFNGWGD